MEIVYILKISLRDGVVLDYVDKDISGIEEEIKDFNEKFASDNLQPEFSIEVKIEESEELGRNSRRKKLRKVQAARKQDKPTKTSGGKYDPKLIEFVREIASSSSRLEAVKAIKDKFEVVMSSDNYAALLVKHGIKGPGRGFKSSGRKRVVDDDEELEMLSPENQY